MNFKDMFNKVVTNAQNFIEKPETQELIAKVKKEAVEFKQKAEAFVEESDEKLKKLIEEKMSKKSTETTESVVEQSDASNDLKTQDVVKKENTEVNVEKVEPQINTVQEVKVTDIHISQMGFKENIEKTLAQAGFDTKNKLKAATDEELTSLSGIGPATLSLIRTKTAE